MVPRVGHEGGSLRMNVCMHVCMYVCMYVCIYGLLCYVMLYNAILCYVCMSVSFYLCIHKPIIIERFTCLGLGNSAARVQIKIIASDGGYIGVV